MKLHSLPELPDLPEDRYSALRSDIALRGVIVPVVVDVWGRVIDGRQRVRAWADLRAAGIAIPNFPIEVRAIDSDEERAAVRLLSNVARLDHLGFRERWEIVTELRSRGWSFCRVAFLLRTRVTGRTANEGG